MHGDRAGVSGSWACVRDRSEKPRAGNPARTTADSPTARIWRRHALIRDKKGNENRKRKGKAYSQYDRYRLRPFPGFTPDRPPQGEAQEPDGVCNQERGIVGPSHARQGEPHGA